MTKEELAERAKSLGVDKLQAKIYGHAKDQLGVQAWKGGWSDGNRFPLQTPGEVTEEDWKPALHWLKARVPG